jgi:hypothetical protein
MKPIKREFKIFKPKYIKPYKAIWLKRIFPIRITKVFKFSDAILKKEQG